MNNKRKNKALIGATLALVVLGACKKPVEPVVPGGLRDVSAPVAAQVDATPDRLAGSWRVVTGVGIPVGSKVSVAASAFTVNGATMPFAQVGPGQYVVGDRPLWVHWLDADARTVAMGDPEGHWYFVMDRTGTPAERLKAAKSILEWYGYDITRL